MTNQPQPTYGELTRTHTIHQSLIDSIRYRKTQHETESIAMDKVGMEESYVSARIAEELGNILTDFENYEINVALFTPQKKAQCRCPCPHNGDGHRHQAN